MVLSHLLGEMSQKQNNNPISSCVNIFPEWNENLRLSDFYSLAVCCGAHTLLSVYICHEGCGTDCRLSFELCLDIAICFYISVLYICGGIHQAVNRCCKIFG